VNLRDLQPSKIQGTNVQETGVSSLICYENITPSEKTSKSEVQAAPA
jgi:hypothetical protein